MTIQNKIQRLINKSQNPRFMREVFEFAKKGYDNKERQRFKDSYIDHALNVAIILQEMNLDDTTVAAGVLDDILDTVEEDAKTSILGEIKKKFGEEVATIVERNYEIKRIYYSLNEDIRENILQGDKAENLRKMFLAIAKDLRVILVDLASRIDGLTKIKQLSSDFQKTYATETIHVFVPIANRMGLGEMKTKLEDLAFLYLDPKTFHWLKENIKEKYEERQKYIEKFIPYFKKILKKERIDYIEIGFRSKSYWSTYQKLKRHNMNFEKIYDLVAIRLIVKDVSACYKVLGIIHKHYRPMSGQIQDYIAKPKENGYKSLHTTVFIDENKISEIQIKTEKMHNEAMFGVCAHWAYKEKINLAKDQEKLKFAEKIPEILKTFNINFFENEIFAFTPKGDIINLPKGATPVDFAYAVHSDIGNHCESAKIGGKIIPLSKPLNSGDVVEIITSKKKKPSVDWLKFVKTGFAKSHIKKIFSATINPILSVPTFITKRILKIGEKQKYVTPEKKQKIPHIYIGGQKDIAASFAKCCSPQPGDAAKAYIGKKGPAAVHKISCKNFQRIAQRFPEKVVNAIWQES